MKYPFQDLTVAETFDQYPDHLRPAMMDIRARIFDLAGQDMRIGPIQECLKWGQPSYLTHKTKSGSTIRLGLSKETEIAVFAHCQTHIIADFQQIFPTDFKYDGNRAVILSSFDVKDLPLDKLDILIKSALTYHIRQKS